MKRRVFALFFCFIVLASLSAASAAAPQVVSVTLTRGTAPVGENQSCTTYVGVPIQGKLSAIDPDGDALTYRLITEPRKGTVTVEANGSFLYTPDENRRGRDTFSFVARDNVGNESGTAVVTVMILRQKTEVTYADASAECAWAGIYLAEKGIYTGRQIGGKWYLRPDDPISESEFAAMCEALTGNAAEAAGDAPLTATAAATILDGAMELTDVKSAETADTAQAMANVAACGLAVTGEGEKPVTVGEAAVMLAKAGQLREK